MDMAVFPMLAVSFFMNLVAIVFVICAVMLILIVLIQKGKGGGLSSAFGGGMASGLLGSKTGDVLTWITVGMMGVVLALSVVMAKYYKPSISNFGVDQPQPTQQMPAQQPPAQQPPVQQQQPPQSSETPLAPAEAGGESTEENPLDK
jgi:preprotein translocase subunit SecG